MARFPTVAASPTRSTSPAFSAARTGSARCGTGKARGGKRKTLEAQGDPLKGVLPTLQTSLTLPELPCTATADSICKILLIFGVGGYRARKFFVVWEVRLCCKVRLRARLVYGMHKGSASNGWRIYARPHPSPTVTPSPLKGKASVCSANLGKGLQHFAN